MKTCEKCHKTNRDEAKFCRFCGEKITVADDIGIIGKKTMQAEFDKLTKTLKVAKQLASMGNQVGLDCLVMGDAGTGKHYMTMIIADMMVKAGLTDKPVKEVAASEWNEFLGKFDENISALQNGILVVNNAQKLLPTTKADRVGELDKLFDKMKNGKAPIVILSGDYNDMTNFLENNKDVAGLFEFRFKLDSFSIDDLVNLTMAMLKKGKHIDVADEALPKLRAHFAWYMRQKELTYVNGRLAEKVANDLCISAKLRNSDTIEAVDIDDDKIFVPKTEEQILRELDHYIGLQSVKDEIRAIVSNVKERREKGMTEKLLKDHFIFTGNPGTGKTTFARKFGEILNAIGALPTGQFVEVSAKEMIGNHLGDTELNVKTTVDKAMGGVLFIDEAYAFASDDGGGFGMDAVNTLLPILENRKGEFVCILAGYTKDMDKLVRMNEGIKSRCNVTIEFPDYSPKELEQLFRMMLTRNDEDTIFTLDARANEMLPKVFERMYLRRTDTFGNARDVRNAFDLALKRHRLRKQQPDYVENQFTYADIVGEADTHEVSVEDVMKELDGFVGMKSVKEAIRRIAQEIAVQKRLIELGMAQEGLTKYNFILTGNPGTGKSTVARIFGKIFKALGVTSTDKVTEKVPKDIIGLYLNESDKLMDAAITEAMGGVLFLDEAYDLEPMDEAGRSTSSEGKKAVQTLMTRMENEAGKFVVVCAGYPKEMAAFMNSNPGLKRRFSHTIHIDDYTAEELLEIYERAAKAKKYNFTLADDTVRMKALNMFRNMVAMKDDKFGNAGEAMKKVAETKTNINNRIASVPFEQWTPEFLQTAYIDDIPYVEPEKVSINDCLEELNQLVGLEGVKASLTKLAHTINNEIESARVENRRPEIPLGHYLFLGNPGTGKTTVARLMGKILYSMGALPSPNVVEVGKANLVGRYLGDTEAITSHVVDTAIGGILFIDEAYQLAEGYEGYGKVALETLVARLENDRGKFVCIAAGYSFEMQQFLAENSGFESRFPKQNRIVFEDYTPEELFDIFMIHARKGGYILDAMAETAVRGKLTMLYNGRGRTFGNGREARHLFDEVKSNLAMRLAEEGGTHTVEERKTIKMEDVL